MKEAEEQVKGFLFGFLLAVILSMCAGCIVWCIHPSVLHLKH
jgi:hypothetical protein